MSVERLLRRRVDSIAHTATPMEVTLECGHIVKRNYTMTELSQWRKLVKGGGGWLATCEACAAIPHPIVNPDAYPKRTL